MICMRMTGGMYKKCDEVHAAAVADISHVDGLVPRSMQKQCSSTAHVN
jgi:hypothetical protein